MPRRETPIDINKGRMVLDVQLGANPTDAKTVRDYLLALMTSLWRQGPGFSSKAPFGKPAWEYVLYDALAREGLIDATSDRNGFFVTVDREAGDRLIEAAIQALGTIS